MTSNAELQWPEGFCDIGGRTFEWVFVNRKEFVEFTAEKMSEPTGLFAKWKKFVTEKVNSDGKESKTEELLEVKGFE